MSNEIPKPTEVLSDIQDALDELETAGTVPKPSAIGKMFLILTNKLGSKLTSEMAPEPFPNTDIPIPPTPSLPAGLPKVPQIISKATRIKLPF